MKARSGSQPCLSRKQSRKKWERRLLAYQQDFLAPRVRAAVEHHLQCCERCQALRTEVTGFLKQLDVAMTLLVSKQPIENLGMEAHRLQMQRRLKRFSN